MLKTKVVLVAAAMSYAAGAVAQEGEPVAQTLEQENAARAGGQERGGAEGQIWGWTGRYSFGVRYGVMNYGGSKMLPDQTISKGAKQAIPGVGTAVPVTTTGTLKEQTTSRDKAQSFGLYMVTPWGFGVGLTQTSNHEKDGWIAQGPVNTTIDGTTKVAKQWAASGTTLVEEDIKFTVDYLDLSYTYNYMGLGSLTLGASVPIANYGTIGVHYGPEGSALLGAFTGAAQGDESLKLKGKSGYALFAEATYAVGSFDILLGYRSEHVKASVDVANSGLRLLSGKNSFDTAANVSIVTLGAGYRL